MAQNAAVDLGRYALFQLQTSESHYRPLVTLCENISEDLIPKCLANQIFILP